MRKSKFTETQIVSTIKQPLAGVPAKDLCHQAGLSDRDSHWALAAARFARRGKRGLDTRAQARERGPTAMQQLRGRSSSRKAPTAVVSR